MDPLLWGLLLLAAGILLLIAEFFLPSGGALAVASAACMIAALVVPFFAAEGSWWRASVVLLVALVGVPITLRATIDLWPRSAFGRLLLIDLPKKPDDVLPEDAVALRSLVGSVGIAKSPMRPSGTVSIGGAYYHALSEGMPIEKGEWVKTVAVRMRQLIVVPAREADLAAAGKTAAPALASPGRATPTKALSATFEDSATRAADLAPADALTKSDDLAASIDSLDLFDAGKSSEDDLSSRM